MNLNEFFVDFNFPFFKSKKLIKFFALTLTSDLNNQYGWFNRIYSQ